MSSGSLGSAVEERRFRAAYVKSSQDAPLGSAELKLALAAFQI